MLCLGGCFKNSFKWLVYREHWTKCTLQTGDIEEDREKRPELLYFQMIKTLESTLRSTNWGVILTLFHLEGKAKAYGKAAGCLR